MSEISDREGAKKRWKCPSSDSEGTNMCRCYLDGYCTCEIPTCTYSLKLLKRGNIKVVEYEVKE